MIFKYTQIRRKINKFQAVEQNNVYKKAMAYIYAKPSVWIYNMKFVNFKSRLPFATYKYFSVNILDFEWFI